MKITKTYLKKVIQEELNRLTEAVEPEEYGDYVGQEYSAKKQFTAPIYMIGRSGFFVKSQDLQQAISDQEVSGNVPSGKDLAFYIDPKQSFTTGANIGKFTKMSGNALQTAKVFDRQAEFKITRRGIEWEGLDDAVYSLKL